MNELYERYKEICISEEDYDKIMELGYVDDLRDFFVGEFVVDDNWFTTQDNEKLKEISDYITQHGIMFFHQVKEDYLKSETLGYFFFRNYLAIVPIAKPTFHFKDIKPMYKHEKSNKKMVLIPLINIYDVEASKENGVTDIKIIYTNGLEDDINFKSDIATYSDKVNSMFDYLEQAENVSFDIASSYSYDELESFISFGFNDIPEGTFKMLKYSTMKFGDLSLVEKMLELKSYSDEKKGLVEIFKPYEELKEQYNLACNEYDRVSKEIEKAKFIKKYILTKALEEVEKEKEVRRIKYRNEGRKALNDILEIVAKLSREEE